MPKRANFAPTSREIRESACPTESEAFANAEHNVANFARIWGRRQCIPSSTSHGQLTVHVPFLDSFARFHAGSAWSSRQAGAGRVGGSIAPSAHVTSAPRSVESPFTTSISYALFHIKMSPACTMTGEMSWAERERNRGWCVRTGGPGSTSGGLKMSSTMSRLASPTGASKPTPNSNNCPKGGTSSCLPRPAGRGSP